MSLRIVHLSETFIKPPASPLSAGASLFVISLACKLGVRSLAPATTARRLNDQQIADLRCEGGFALQ